MDDILDLGALIGVPQSIANLQLPDPSLRDFYRDENDRIFWVDDEINDNILALVKMIIRCNKEDEGIPSNGRSPIKVFINSMGGDACTLLTTMKTIKLSKTPIYTINYCQAYSAAADLLASGHKRYAFPGTSVMIHSGSCMYGGTAEQAESMRKYYDKLSKRIVEDVLKSTGIDSKVYKKKAPSDWYMDENEALENGVIDEIITDIDALLF